MCIGLVSRKRNAVTVQGSLPLLVTEHVYRLRICIITVCVMLLSIDILSSKWEWHYIETCIRNVACGLGMTVLSS